MLVFERKMDRPLEKYSNSYLVNDSNNLGKETLEQNLSRKKTNEKPVPGTVHLLDIEGNLNVKKEEGGKNIILKPQPSSNVNDPLRWSKKKKLSQFCFLWLLSFLLAVLSNFSGPLYEEFTKQLNCTIMDCNVSSAICFIFLGIGCALLQPTALKLGRRFVYMLCTVFAIASTAIGSQATSIQYLYGLNLLSGLSGAVVDSLVEISTTDVFFQHERAQYIAWFVFALYAGCNLGPVAAGYVNQSMGWRWCFYFQLIFFCVIFAVEIFYMEDTTFARDDEVENDILGQIKSRETVLSAVRSGELPPEFAEKSNAGVNVNPLKNDEEGEDDDSIDHRIQRRTYWQRMKPIELEYNNKRPWLSIASKPALLVCFPAVIWAGLVYGAQMMWLSLLSTTQSEIYSAKPYNFSTPQVGLTNVAAFVGAVFGMFYGGKFVDYVALKLAERNNGVLEPEFRLWTMIVPTIFNAGGLIAYGLPAYYGAHWAYSVVIGQGLLGFAMAASGGICLSYAIDCYSKLASEAMVLMLFSRNAIGCGFTFAIQPWLDRDGLSLTVWLMFMISLVINGSFLVMIKWGKDFRRRTASLYEKLSEQEYSFGFKQIH